MKNCSLPALEAFVFMNNVESLAERMKHNGKALFDEVHAGNKKYCDRSLMLTKNSVGMYSEEEKQLCLFYIIQLQGRICQVSTKISDKKCNGGQKHEISTNLC